MRKNMKTMTAAIMASAAVLGSTMICGASDTEKLNVVTTIFPEYDWVREVIGEDAEHYDLTMLLDNGVDLHSFQPTAEDILKISSCDLFIYVGGESDKWVKDALAEAINEDMVVLNLLEVLGDQAKEEELVEGMEGEEEEEEGEEEEETEYDEHVWLSLKNAQAYVSTICDALSEIDPEHADILAANASAYQEKLIALDAKYQEAVDAGSVDTLLFGDRFPFRYLVDDYGLNYYAAFIGCSAETEASFETITFLAEKVDELALHSVMALEGSDKRIAETVIQSTSEKNAQILTLDSMQSVTAKDVEAGAEYLAIMESNLDALAEALK